jgi:elongator complex protein 1
MGELRRNYTIDDRLGRTDKALQSLHGMGAASLEEVKRYVQKHNLYTKAFELYKYQSEDLKSLTKIYADHLAENSQFREAALG